MTYEYWYKNDPSNYSAMNHDLIFCLDYLKDFYPELWVVIGYGDHILSNTEDINNLTNTHKILKLV